jgi:hypothetical protein
MLLHDADADLRTRHLQAVVWFFIYRYGARVSEALGLRRKDIVNADGKPIILFRNNDYREIKSDAGIGRSYRGTLKVEGDVDGLRRHNLAFSVHGAPLPNSGGSDDLNSAKRFFSGKVDARIFLKLLAHFVDRSICVFELHEFVDPLAIPGKGCSYEMCAFEFVRKPDPGLFAE